MVSIDAIITDLPQEHFRDSMMHLEKAREMVGNTDPFPLWREVRATVIFAFTAIEAFMNKMAFYYLEKNKDIDPFIVDYLKERQPIFKNGSKTYNKKYLSLDDKITDWTIIITGNKFDKSDFVWQNFIKIKKFRNIMLHGHPDSEEIYDNATLEMAQLAVDTVSNIIKRFYEYDGNRYPPWVDINKME